MTPRKSRLKLETAAVIREQGKPREIVIEWSPGEPDVLWLRAKGMRTRYAVPLARVYTQAAGAASIPKGRKVR
jgi:hypothetical protein